MSDNKRSGLPEDVVVGILVWLPVKSLIRFKGVCKFWCAHIVDQNFVDKHIAIHRHNKNKDSNLELLLASAGKDRKEWSYTLLSLSFENLQVVEHIDMPFARKGLQAILGPCNGVLCCVTYWGVWLWNPGTREVKHLPESTVKRPDWAYSFVKSPDGFGLDLITNGYKVFRVVASWEEEYPSCMHQFDLYSLDSDSWKEIPLPCQLMNGVPIEVFPFRYFDDDGVFLNGIYHWLFSNKHLDGFNSIISFDVAQENFQFMPIPDLLPFITPDTIYFLQLALFDQCLVFCLDIVIGQEGDKDCHVYHLWIMKEYGVKLPWTKLSVIGPMVGLNKLIGFWNDGALVFARSEQQLIWCHLETNEFRKFLIDASLSGQDDRILILSESMVSIKGRQEEEEQMSRTVNHMSLARREY